MRQRREQPRVAGAYSGAALMTFIPGLILIARLIAECRHDPIQIMGILSLDMLLDQLDSTVELFGHPHHSPCRPSPCSGRSSASFNQPTLLRVQMWSFGGTS